MLCYFTKTSISVSIISLDVCCYSLGFEHYMLVSEAHVLLSRRWTHSALYLWIQILVHFRCQVDVYVFWGLLLV